MKFTQEDLLNAMGLKVGDKVLFDYSRSGTIAKIGHNPYNSVIVIYEDDESETIQRLVGCEYSVIAQPKYTLTETEKHIVLAIDEKWKWIARDRDGLHIYTTLPKFDYDYEDFGCTDGYTEYFNVFIDNFKYVVENEEPVSLDELRQIAKGETK